MLVFIDESGDAGLKIKKGSSRYFVIALVSFEENEEATACDQRIELLKRELKLSQGAEFKFNKLRKDQRLKFFEAVAPYAFFYFAIIINKEKLYGDGFKIKESFYKYTCSLVFENAKPYFKEAIIVIDGSGSREFKRQLKTYLRKKIGTSIIKKVKIQSSHSNNLLQLADMVAGATHRSFTKKGDKEVYRKVIKAKEIYAQFWPK
ncbi:MAG: DUF3800 domain-containing protein [Candidatus Nealsonbacteria bacterium]|nr:DUF3800 domain-containing protein [Candidatus Nealsonbacteria bacterium]